MARHRDVARGYQYEFFIPFIGEFRMMSSVLAQKIEHIQVKPDLRDALSN